MADRAEMVNPLREGLGHERMPGACAVVIFGASGDLTKRKLVPALYNLARDRLLPPGFAVVGTARSSLSHDEFRRRMREATEQFARIRPIEGAVWDHFAKGLYYVPGNFADPAEFSRLGDALNQVDAEQGTGGNQLFYLATPPSAYPEIIRQLGAAGLARPGAGQWVRVVIEKPFGSDLASARDLNRQVAQVFREEQVYRIDHYLGKETVQNILVFRFANGIFEPIWNRRYIDHVQITVAENLGVEGRGAYYEEAGVLRDMVQNHMLQLLTLMAMEPPVAFDADAVRGEKVKVLRAVRPIEGNEIARRTVRGQYGEGTAAGKRVPAYRTEPGVKPDSATETFAALKVLIDSWRWADVPFFLRSGKRLPKPVTEIAIQFRQAPHLLFRRTAEDQVEPNVLVLHIQPDEGITLRFGAKRPGPGVHLRWVNMDFQYGTAFGAASPTAYETLLLDCMRGDPTLFTRHDEVEAAWALITPILEAWADGPAAAFPNYPAGTWGPPEAEAFIEGDGRRWRRL